MEKRNWKENRPLAFAALVLAVLVGIFVIGGAKARGVANTANRAYQDTIAGDLALRAAAAENIVEVAKAALGEDAASVQSAQKALARLNDADGPALAYQANTELTASIGMLYEETRLVTGDAKGSVLQTQWSEFLSRGNIIDRSAAAYNEQARTAKKKLSGFPASLVSALSGAHVEEFTA